MLVGDDFGHICSDLGSKWISKSVYVFFRILNLLPFAQDEGGPLPPNPPHPMAPPFLGLGQMEPFQVLERAG
jgi:hypothetical protein